ncbi:MAG: hypothetical protein M0Q94_13115 [Candidatus Cloacimonetes bacterium]|nr:hypothetical protein [Candidatus Cloacimonadota bacterium]
MKKKIIKFLLLILIFDILSCNLVRRYDNKVIESYGDKSLKYLNLTQDNHYIGISNRSDNLQEAVNDAIDNAHKLINQNLGIAIDYIYTDYNLTIESNQQIELSHKTEQKISISSSHKISSEIQSYYIEKYISNTEVFYMAWVQLYFSKDNFLNYYYVKWNNFIENYSFKNLLLFDNKFIQNITIINKLYPEYLQEKEYLSLTLRLSVEDIYANYNNFYKKSIENITIESVFKKDKFSNDFKLQVKLNDQKLSNFPFVYDNEIIFSDNNGIIKISPDYQKEFIIYTSDINNDDIPKKILYVNNSFSPYIKTNYTICFESNDEIIKNEFSNLFRENGFLEKTNADIKLIISAKTGVNKININTYYALTDLSIEIIKSKAKSAVLLFKGIEGYGKTASEATSNSYTLEWYKEKYSLIYQVENAIISLLLK